MTSDKLKVFLQQTLEDHRLTRSERSALQDRITAAGLDCRQLAHLRSTVFDVARESLAKVETPLLLDWIEESLKVLLPAANATETSEAWFSPRDNCPGRIRSLLGQARMSADLCVFTITDDRLSEAILAAHDRGVRVRIITDNDKSHDLGSDAGRFLDAGIAIRTDRSQYHMHHKFAIFDQQLLLNGSYNWTRGAAACNEENFIITSDRRLITAFSEAFESLWSHVASATG